MKIALKIGGSLIIGPKGPRKEYVKKIIPVLNRLKRKTKLLIVGIGGGKLVRNYFQSAGPFLKDSELEMVGIDILRANARFLSYLIGGQPVFDLEKIPKSKVLVVSGIKPGRSTDANTAILAKKMNVDVFIILTNVNGIYTKDPKRFKDALLIKEIRFKYLGKLVKRKTSPGDYGVVDPLALKTIAVGKIHTYVVNGKNPKVIFDILKGRNPGTEIL